MGRLIVGGRFSIAKTASETDFQQARSGVALTGPSFVDIPNYEAKRGIRGINKVQDSLAKQATFSDVTRNAPLFNDPRYTSSTLSIPTDERTLNGLYRFFTETDPIVGSAIRLQTELPLADLKLGQCEDPGVQQHYEEMWDRINGYKLLTDITSERSEIGNVYPFGAFNEHDYMWDQFAILNPDYTKVESTWINQKPLIKLIPDEALKKIVQTQSPSFIFKQLPQEIIKNVLFNQEIPLASNNTFHITHAKRPYELRGKSIIKRILKTLMLEDRFNQANFALATRHAVPITVVKVGDPSTGWLPAPEEIDSVREAFSAYDLDPNFSLFYHYGINIEFYGSNGRMLPVGPELDRIYRLKFIGLNMHEQLMTGAGGSYSQAYINLEVQRQRYLNLQLQLETFYHQGVCKPVADLCGFYRIKQPVSGYTGVTSSKYGPEDRTEIDTLKQTSTLRDFQDNEEYKRFQAAKITEAAEQRKHEVREYVFPKLDWGGMNAATDENLKNYIKWLQKERPWLVDDATLARLGRLDRDTQEKAYVKDLERTAERYKVLSQKGLLPFALQKGNQGPADMGGIGDINVGPTGGIGAEPGMVGGGEPNAPAGEGGPPEAANAQVPPQGVQSSLRLMEKDITADVLRDDVHIAAENQALIKAKEYESKALFKVVNR
jgi:hypothetical protein